MIDSIFDLCVLIMIYLANLLGLTYEAINVWIFVILWPIFTLALIGIIIWQRLQIRYLRKRNDSLPSDL